VEKKRLIVIGGVAAGTKAASKAKRENPELEVIILTKEKDISYAGCGLPYYVGGIISERKELVVRTAEDFDRDQDITVLTEHEVTKIDPQAKTITYDNKVKAEIKTMAYDSLVLAMGASPVLPKLDGRELANIHTLRTPTDAEAVRKLVDAGKVKDAIVVGAGFIGLEAAENLHHRGVNVTIVEFAPLILPGYDEEMSIYVKNYLIENGVNIRTGVGVSGFVGDETGKVSGVKIGEEELPAQLVIWAGGVKPNVALAKEAGIEIGPTGAIAVNEYQETNIPGIYAAGDCTENTHLITKEKVWFAMGSTANKTGRIAGLNIVKEKADYLPGVLGTSIVKLFDLNAARTGLTEKQAIEKGYKVESVIVPGNDRAHYFPGYRQINTKLIADSTNGRILGAQIIGEGIVDKPIDIIATAISFEGTLEQISRLDLAYAPPFSMAMSSTILAANVLRNKIEGKYKGINPRDLKKAVENNEIEVLDVRTEAEHFLKAIPGSINIPEDELEARKDEIPQNKRVVIACKVGKRAYLSQHRLRKLGCNDLRIMDGGIDCYCYDLN
jgi:NADPH-dependent 2,4-dienoyl-CoA reductase/sulfur reductase-like enzyme/rhodanese-related sulfurtransferase